jgi:hypothetical protein
MLQLVRINASGKKLFAAPQDNRGEKKLVLV